MEEKICGVHRTTLTARGSCMKCVAINRAEGPHGRGDGVYHNAGFFKKGHRG